ncbi:MAG: FmdE family protein [Acidimicrobiales bacterium]
MIDQDALEHMVRFHGHMCAGLALGARAADIALRELGVGPGDVVAAVETHTCSVDAIQAMTGCTLGNGKLFYLDHAKNAYTFWGPDGAAVRVLALPDDRPPEVWDRFARVQSGQASQEELAEFFAFQQEWSKAILETPQEQLFRVERVDEAAPSRPPISAPVVCADCGEATMSAWAREVGGRRLCPPCTEKAGALGRLR